MKEWVSAFWTFIDVHPIITTFLIMIVGCCFTWGTFELLQWLADREDIDQW